MRRSPAQVYGDDVIRECLLAPVTETHAAVAQRLGIPKSTVEAYRRRQIPRALLIADELGLPRRQTKSRIHFRSHSATDERAMIARIMAGDE